MKTGKLSRIDVAEGGAEEGEAVEGDDPVGRVHHRVVQHVAARLHVAIPATESGFFHKRVATGCVNTASAPFTQPWLFLYSSYEL